MFQLSGDVGAEHGDAESQFRIGELFYQGENIPDDEREAWMKFKFFGQGAISPIYYKKTDGWEKGLEEAGKWYHKAAKQGHIKSEYRLGCLYSDLSRLGDPLIYDKNREKYKKTAEQWYLKAAKKGYADAQHSLGTFYEFVKDDSGWAARWYQEAAEQGHAMAQYCLGRLMGGDAYWFRKAAEQGLAEAQCALGVLYHIGDGVPQDSQIAKAWLEQAANRGYADARRYLDLWYPQKSWLNKLFS